MVDLTISATTWAKAKALQDAGVNLGNRGYADGTPKQQLAGMAAEITVAHWLGVEEPDFQSGDDGGFDFEIGQVRIDLKTMQRRQKPPMDYVANLPRVQWERHGCDAYLLANLSGSELTLMAWIERDRVPEVGTRVNKGDLRSRGPNYPALPALVDAFEIEYRDANGISGVDEFRASLLPNEE